MDSIVLEIWKGKGKGMKEKDMKEVIECLVQSRYVQSYHNKSLSSVQQM